MGLMNIRRMMMNSAPQEVTVGPSAIASFSTNLAVPMKSVKVNIDPIQDLHGQDSPYPAGGGKNLFDALTWEQLDRNANFYTVASDETITVIANDSSGISNRLFDISANETYSFLSTFATAIRIFNSSSQTIIQSVSGTFTAPADGKIAIKFYVSAYPTSGKFILVKGSTVPTAWSPYSNICPISGRTEVNVEHTGVNVWDEEWEVGRINISTGENQNATGIRSKNYVPVVPSTTYYVKSSSNENVFVIEYDADKNYIRYASYYKNRVYTTSANAHYIRFYKVSVTTYNHDININYPSTDTAYHPYTGQSINIALGQTVYGGTLDVVSGVLTIDRATVDLGTLNWTLYPKDTYQDFRSSAIDDSKVYAASEKPNAVCDSFKVEKRNGQGTNYTLGITASKYVGINTPLNSYSDATSFKSAMSGVQLVYELTTPITIQLAPHEVRSYLGGNNMWADSGDIEATYYTKP